MSTSQGIKDLENIELLIDRIGLESVIRGLSLICEVKVQHIEENWQDRVLVAAWRRAGALLSVTADKIRNLKL